MQISKYIVKLFSIPYILNNRISPIFNKWYFKAKGTSIGKDFHVTGKVFLDNNGSFDIGDGFYMTSGGHHNPISSNLQGHVYISKNAHVSIGNHVYISSTRLWISKELFIGNYVSLGANVLIIDTDCHQIDYKVRCCPENITDNLSFCERDEHIQCSPVRIEDYVWIGAHSIILKGVTIGEHSIIGAGSVVTKDIPENCIAAGNPCKVIRKFN